MERVTSWYKRKKIIGNEENKRSLIVRKKSESARKELVREQCLSGFDVYRGVREREILFPNLAVDKSIKRS